MLRAVTVAIALLTVLPATAGARPGVLDKRFSGDGLRKVTRDHGSIPAAVTPAPGGGLYVAVHGRFSVLKVRRDGTLDPAFGRRGVAVVPSDLSWDGNNEPIAIAVRPTDGAILVAGRIRGDAVAIVAISRRGRLLSTFGRGGRVYFPLRTFGWGARQLLVDRASGAVTWVIARSNYPHPVTGIDPDLVWVRLTATGDLDRKFGDGGIVHTPLRAPAGYGEGGVALWRTPSGRLRALATDIVGRRWRFGVDAGGHPDLPVEPAPFGAAIATVGADLLVAEGGYTSVRIVRRADSGLGAARWTARLGGRLRSAGAPISDGHGGAYVVGTAHRNPRTKNFRRVVAIGHIKAGGTIDRRFGRNGVLDITLGPNTIISVPSLVLDRARNRLWLVADAGSGFFDIREDFGGHDVLVAAIRTL